MGHPRRTEYLPLDDLRPDPANPKRHDAEGLAASIGRHGFVEQIVMDDRTGLLVGGHGRAEALKAAHRAGTAPPDGIHLGDDGRWYAPVIRGWASRDADDATVAVIALNTLTVKGGTDDTRLLAMLEEVSATAAGLAGTGFKPSALDDLIARAQEAAADTDEWASALAERQVRSVILEFSLDDFRFVTETAARARRHYEVGSNAELFQKLLEEAAETVAA